VFKLGLASLIVLMLAWGTPVFGDHRVVAGIVSALVLFLLIRSWLSISTPLGGRMHTARIEPGHKHWDTAIHEGGHAVAAKRLGGKVISAKVYPDGSGLVQARMKDNPENFIAFWYAGQYAMGSSRGAGHDNSSIRKELNKLPSNMRGQVHAAAKRKARSIVSNNKGEIQRFAKGL
jgi:hypothetical protein